jgi:hypothetical protein
LLLWVLVEIPPGTSSVSFKLFVPLEQYELGPLRLTAFKVGRLQNIMRRDLPS